MNRTTSPSLFLVLVLFVGVALITTPVPLSSQTQDKTDEQSICREFIQNTNGVANRHNDVAAHLAVPKVDCHDQITYSHVMLTYPVDVQPTVRGIILRDDRPESCGSGGCAISLLVQGCRDIASSEGENCRNNWFQAIETVGFDMQVTSVSHSGWYDIVVTEKNYGAGSSQIHRSTYRYIGNGTYTDVGTIPSDGKVVIKYFNSESTFFPSRRDISLAVVGQGRTEFPLVCDPNWARIRNFNCGEFLSGRTYNVQRVDASDPNVYPAFPNAVGATLLIDKSYYFVVDGTWAGKALDSAKRAFELERRQRLRKASFATLDLHSNQSQARVKLVLQQHGFQPWDCAPAPGNAAVTRCVASRRSPVQDEIWLFFIPVLRRDEDSGRSFIVDRVLTLLSYKLAGDDSSDVISAGPSPF